MHGKVVRLSEKLIQGKPIHPDFETLRHKGGGGGAPVSLVNVAVLLLILMHSHYYILTYL